MVNQMVRLSNGRDQTNCLVGSLDRFKEKSYE
jgi:hypothetical protein